MNTFKFFYQALGKINYSSDWDYFRRKDLQDILWIDLIDPVEEEAKELEQYLSIRLQSDNQIEEIEISSRYQETDDSIITNSHFVINASEIIENNVSFIIKNNILISLRDRDLPSFTMSYKKLLNSPRIFTSGFHVFVAILETRIDLDADIIEHLAREITMLSQSVTNKKVLDEKSLISVNNLLEKTMTMHENAIDKQRVISSMLRSELFPVELKPKLNIIIKDINSLIDHTKFHFERLEYLQDTFLGLVNIEQNKIIKIFTVVSVIFMPPTLIASIYGMNFKFIHELNWIYGYPFSLGLMILSSGITLFLFKKKHWL